MQYFILAGVEKGEVILDSVVPKSDFLLFVKNDNLTLSTNMGTRSDSTKNLS